MSDRSVFTPPKVQGFRPVPGLRDVWVRVMVCPECLYVMGIGGIDHGGDWYWHRSCRVPPDCCTGCGLVLFVSDESRTVQKASAFFHSNVIWYLPATWQGFTGHWELRPADLVELMVMSEPPKEGSNGR